jgi:hypothetical protein
MAKAPSGNGAEIDHHLPLTEGMPPSWECLHLGAFTLHLINCRHNIVPDKLGFIHMIRSPPTWSFSKVSYLNDCGGGEIFICSRGLHTNSLF